MRWSGLVVALLVGGCAGSGSLDATAMPAASSSRSPHTATGTVRDACIAEWTVENDIATGYRGSDSAAVTTELAGRRGPTDGSSRHEAKSPAVRGPSRLQQWWAHQGSNLGPAD